MLIFFWGKHSLIIARCLSDAERQQKDVTYKLLVQRAMIWDHTDDNPYANIAPNDIPQFRHQRCNAAFEKVKNDPTCLFSSIS